MKTNPSTRRDRAAFTRKDLLVVVGIFMLLCIIASMLLPTLGREPYRGRIRCAEKQKQIGTAFRVFASDNDDRYPLQAPNHPYIYPPGGSRTAVGAVESSVAQPWQVFQSMWNELQSPRILLCHEDEERIRAAERVTNFNGLAGATNEMTAASLGHPDNQNLAVSYAVQAQADESRPLALLTIDRKLTGRRIGPHRARPSRRAAADWQSVRRTRQSRCIGLALRCPAAMASTEFSAWRTAA